MATIVEESEDVFESHKARIADRVRGVIAEYFTADKTDFADDLMDVLDVEKLPNFSVEVVLRLGKQTISIPGFEAEEKDDEDEDTEDDE